jgi:hypothetical protein
MRALFRLHTAKHGLNEKDHDLSTAHFRRVEDPNQLSLF